MPTLKAEGAASIRGKRESLACIFVSRLESTQFRLHMYPGQTDIVTWQHLEIGLEKGPEINRCRSPTDMSQSDKSELHYSKFKVQRNAPSKRVT